jgi:serine/threonine protein kinase
MKPTRHCIKCILSPSFARVDRSFRFLTRLFQGALSEKRARYLLRQLLLGITYLHRLCIIHRDLKPTNILLSSKDPMTQVVKVLPPLNNYYQKLRKLNYYRLLILAMQLLQGKQRGSISRSARSAIGLPRSSLKRATISPRMFGQQGSSCTVWSAGSFRSITKTTVNLSLAYQKEESTDLAMSIKGFRKDVEMCLLTPETCCGKCLSIWL